MQTADSMQAWRIYLLIYSTALASQLASCKILQAPKRGSMNNAHDSHPSTMSPQLLMCIGFSSCRSAQVPQLHRSRPHTRKLWPGCEARLLASCVRLPCFAAQACVQLLCILLHGLHFCVHGPDQGELLSLGLRA
jgi:hypothetical protein